MEYYRDPNNQIYADITYRLGRIIKQYESINSEDKYEVTLYISVLHTLLVVYKDYSSRACRIYDQTLLKNRSIDDYYDEWYIHSLYKEKNLTNFVHSLRNSISHPNPIVLNNEFKSTGYTTLNDKSKKIQNIVFINSPDVRYNNPIYFPSSYKLKKYMRDNNIPDDIQINPIDKNKYGMFKDDKPFFRFSEIKLNVSQLRSFLFFLIELLSKPILDKENSKLFIEIAQQYDILEYNFSSHY